MEVVEKALHNVSDKKGQQVFVHVNKKKQWLGETTAWV